MAAKDLVENVMEQKRSIEDIYSELEKVLQSHKKLQTDMVIMGKFFKDEISQVKKSLVESNKSNSATDTNLIDIATNINNLENKLNQILENGVGVSGGGDLDKLFLKYVRDELTERENKVVQQVEEILAKQLSKAKK